MKHLAQTTLIGFAMALALSGCGSIEHRSLSQGLQQQGQQQVYEPPAWNTIEMMMLETEIVSAEELRRKIAAGERAANLKTGAANS